MEGNEIIDEHMIRIKYREFYVCDDSEKEGEDEKRREEKRRGSLTSTPLGSPS